MSASDWQQLLGTLLQKQGGEPRGCSESDIAALEQRHHCRLPRTYVDFLRRVGHSADRVFRGEDVAYKHLDRMNETARDYAEELGATWADQAFAFWSHQGEHYYFFLTGQGDDPSVFSIFEDSPIVIQLVRERLSDFLSEFIQQELDRPEPPPNLKVYRYDD